MRECGKQLITISDRPARYDIQKYWKWKNESSSSNFIIIYVFQSSFVVTWIFALSLWQSLDILLQTPHIVELWSKPSEITEIKKNNASLSKNTPIKITCSTTKIQAK